MHVCVRRAPATHVAGEALVRAHFLHFFGMQMLECVCVCGCV